jgi:hypothetical protein
VRAGNPTIAEVDIRNSVKVVAWNPKKLKAVQAEGEGILSSKVFLGQPEDLLRS